MLGYGKDKFEVLCKDIKAMLEVMIQMGQVTYDELKSVLWQG